eukprot:scaffold8935_cov69-Phaeocystis_antarctica.AAC.3
MGPMVQSGVGMLLELVPFELERVLVDGNDRIELLAVCARARDELALLSALDHARRVEPAFVGTRVDLPGRVRRRWASGSSEGWCCKYGAGWVASERRGRGRTRSSTAKRRCYRSIVSAAFLARLDISESLDLCPDLLLDVGDDLPLRFFFGGGLRLVERLQLVLLEPDRLLVHGDDRLQLGARRACDRSNGVRSRQSTTTRSAGVRFLPGDGGTRRRRV